MKKIIVGNWKMAPVTLKEAKQTFLGIKKKAGLLKNVQTVVCPPFLFLNELQKGMSGSRCLLGVQDVFWEREGAHTGEVSAAMAAKAKAKYTIVGHSERRASGETDEDVSKKISAAVKENLQVILCVGEKDRDESGEYFRFVAEQVRRSLDGVSKNATKNIIVAYEPVWAIGKDAQRPAAPEDVVEMALLIRKTLSDMYGKRIADHIPVLYGGSVDETNAKEFIQEHGVNGLLVGRASLHAEKFNKILETANSI